MDFCNYIPVQISAMDESLEMEVSVAECGGTANSAKQDNNAVFEKVLIVCNNAPATPNAKSTLKAKATPSANATPNIKERITPEDFNGVSLFHLKIEDRNVVVNGKQVTRKTLVEIHGHNVKSIIVKLLRKVCSILKVSGYKNKSKDNMLVIMGQHKYNV